MNDKFLNYIINNFLNLKASLYDLNLLGHTRITIIKIIRNNYENINKSLKIIIVQIILCNSNI
jgi:hypothetical protein